MKQHWTRISARIDALTLRERVVIFLMAALVVVTGMNLLVLGPQEAEQLAITKRMQDEQNEIARVRVQIQQKVAEKTSDPDAQNRVRLLVLEEQARTLNQAVAGLQKGLVSPDKMPGLLESMLRRNTRLRLTSMKKLPVANLAEVPGDTQGVAAATGLYRHGVELTVQGNYVDMLNYLNELEGLGTQLLWGDLRFAVETHPTASMTVTVYTLSLDKQWLHI